MKRITIITLLVVLTSVWVTGLGAAFVRDVSEMSIVGAFVNHHVPVPSQTLFCLDHVSSRLLLLAAGFLSVGLVVLEWMDKSERRRLIIQIGTLAIWHTLIFAVVFLVYLPIWKIGETIQKDEASQQSAAPLPRAPQSGHSDGAH